MRAGPGLNCSDSEGMWGLQGGSEGGREGGSDCEKGFCEAGSCKGCEGDSDEGLGLQRL